MRSTLFEETSHENIRNPQKTSNISDFEDKPRHVYRLSKLLSVTRDDISHHGNSSNLISISFISQSSKYVTKSWRKATICGVIQNLGWTRLESTLKIITIRNENSSFEWNLTFEIWISEVSGLATGGPSDFQNLSPGGECFAPRSDRWIASTSRLQVRACHKYLGHSSCG